MRLFSILLLICASSARASDTPSRFGWTYESVKPDAVRQVEAAADFLAKTPTGSSVLAALKTFPITVYVDVPNGGGQLKGGTFATGRVVSRSRA